MSRESERLTVVELHNTGVKTDNLLQRMDDLQHYKALQGEWRNLGQRPPQHSDNTGEHQQDSLSH